MSKRKRLQPWPLATAALSILPMLACSIFQSYLSTGAIHLVCPNTALRMTAQHGDVLAFRAVNVVECSGSG